MTIQRIAIQIFQNGEAVAEKVADIHAETEQAAVDYIFSHLRIDLRYRFLGMHGFVLPTPSVNDYMLWNGGKA